jgi:hypothetical protein
MVAVRVVAFTTVVGWETPSHESTVTETKLVPFAARLIGVPTLAVVREIEASVWFGGLHL